MSEFVTLIAQDAAMAAKVMAVANSSAYRGSGPQQGLERALALLGTEMVKTLVISQAILQAFNGLPAIRRLDLGAFWQHALMAAAAAREAARHLDYAREDEAYLAGLLHDIGRLGLLVAAPEEYAEGFNAADDRAHCEAERRLLQISHAEAGAWLIERWQLDDYIADSVRYHHEPLPRLAATHPLIRIVAFAHLLAQQAADAPQVIEAGALCGMAPPQVAEVAERARAKLFKAAEQLGLAAPSASATAAADRLRAELAPLMVAAAVLKDLPLRGGESERLQRVADAARIVFQFSDVVVMLPDADGRLLRWIGAVQPVSSAALPAQWREFSMPSVAGTRLGDGLLARKPVFIVRRKSDAAAEALSVAEDQLLRLLGADHLVCLPLTVAPAAGAPHGAAGGHAGMLVCVGNAALVAGLRVRQAFLTAFLGEADRAQARGQRLSAEAERDRADLAARQLDLARDLVHEVNNPLAIIQNYLSLLDARLGNGAAPTAPGAMAADIAVLQEEVARVGRLVQAMAATATSAAGAPDGLVDVDALIAEVVRLFRHGGASPVGVEILGHGHGAAHEVRIERDLLKQVLINLVKNAVEALAPPPEGASDLDHPPGRVVLANNGLVNRDGRLWLELSVRDNGPGLPEELLATLFAQPGLIADSAKPGADRGRGLAITYRLVTGLGGLLQCRSSSIGTSFDIYLPLSPARPSDLQPKAT